MLLFFLSISYFIPIVSVFLNYRKDTGILNTTYFHLFLPVIITLFLAGVLVFVYQKYKTNFTKWHYSILAVLFTLSFLHFTSSPVFKYIKYTGIIGFIILALIWLEPVIRSLALKNISRYISISLSYILVFLAILEPILIYPQISKLENLNPFFQKEGFIDFLSLFDNTRILEGGYLKQNVHSNYLIGDGSIGRVNINSLGFRSKWELENPKSKEEFRILLAGDSFTVGYRIDDAFTMGGLLESEFANDKSKFVKTFTAGLFEQYSVLQWQKKYPNHFEADTLIVGICLGNDLVQTYTKLKSIELGQTFKYHPVNDPYYNQVLEKEKLPVTALDPKSSFNYNAWNPATAIRKELRISEMLKLYRPTGIWTMPLPGSIPTWDSMNGFGAFLKNSNETYSELFQYFENALVEIDKNAKQAGIQVHFVVYPMRFQQSEAEWNATKELYALNHSAFDLENPNRIIASICNKNQLSCLDLLPLFKENGSQILHFPFDQHWNKQGNLLAGKEIAKFIKEKYFK